MLAKRLFPAMLILSVLLLTGCGAGMSPVKITESMVNEAGEVISTGITETADVDVVRSTNFRKMRINRDTVQAKAHEKEGFRMKFQTVALGGGFTAYLPEEISYTPELRFQDPMPLQEMENPMYRTTKEIVLGIGGFIKDGFLGWLLYEAHSDSVGAAQSKYSGDYNPQNYQNSFNSPITTFAPPL